MNSGANLNSPQRAVDRVDAAAEIINQLRAQVEQLNSMLRLEQALRRRWQRAFPQRPLGPPADMHHITKD